MFVKRKQSRSHLSDLAEIFRVLHRYLIKLNPTECVFGVSFGKFLDFMVNNREIEANFEKIQAVLEKIN